MTSNNLKNFDLCTYNHAHNLISNLLKDFFKDIGCGTRVAVHCRTKGEAKKLVNLTNSTHIYLELWNKYEADTCFEIKKERATFNQYQILSYCDVSYFQECCYKILEFSELESKINGTLENLFSNMYASVAGIEVGDIVEDISQDMYGVVLDEISDEEVYIYTDNGCVEKWEKEKLVNTGEKKDLSFLQLHKPGEISYESEYE